MPHLPFATLIYIVTNTQDSVWEGRIKVGLYRRCTSETQQCFFKKHYLFIIFFIFSNIGLFPSAPQISSPQVSVTAFTNVSLRCLVGVRPSDCWDNALQWSFSNSATRLQSGEKYEIQERETKTKCKTEFIITIFNVTEADDGKYKCTWFCEIDYPSLSKNSTIQLKVFPLPAVSTASPIGMNNCVIISRLRLVPQFSSGIVDRGRIAFSRVGWFSRALAFRSLSLRKNGGLLVV